MFAQNIIKLGAAVHELSCAQRNKKNSEEHNAVRCYRADSKYKLHVRLYVNQYTNCL